MLLRKDVEGVIAISQPAHAWVSGQLARNWRAQDFVGVREEVCVAAEQHDIGFMNWEQSPTLNPETGLPHSFLEMPRAMHLDLWSAGIQQVLRLGRYPSLLVSKHFTKLAQLNGREGTPKEEELLGQFLDRQEAFQTSLVTSLANDFHYGEFSTEEILLHHQQLVSLWDWMSLLFCHGLQQAQTVSWLPWKLPCRELKLTPLDSDGARIQVAP